MFLTRLLNQRAALVAELDALRAEADELAADETRSWSDEETARGDEILARLGAIPTEVAVLDERIATLEVEVERNTNARRAPVPGMLPPAAEVRDISTLSASEARGRARTFLEEARSFQSDSHRESVARLIDTKDNSYGGGDHAARMTLLTGREVYRTAWAKYMTGNTLAMTEQEREALSQGVDKLTTQERAMTSGTGASGGYFVPVFIDPTMILTGAGAVNPLRQIATVKQISPAFGGWYGATAAQVTAAWTAEGAAAPDNTPVVSQPNIPVWMAEAFVAVSYQGFEDVDSLEQDVLTLFADAKVNLEAIAFQTGSGSSQPKGVMTAVSAVAGSRIASATAATYALADAFSLHAALPARFRNAQTEGSVRNRAFLASLTTIDKTRQLAMAQNSANSVWTDIYGNFPAKFLGDDIYEGSSLSTNITTTGQDIMLFGDFSRYYIIDRVGFSTEFIPNLFDQATGRPSAQRGWISHWRTGADAVDTNAFRDLRLS